LGIFLFKLCKNAKWVFISPGTAEFLERIKAVHRHLVFVPFERRVEDFDGVLDGILLIVGVPVVEVINQIFGRLCDQNFIGVIVSLDF
jgi:hypothetical protein